MKRALPNKDSAQGWITAGMLVLVGFGTAVLCYAIFVPPKPVVVYQAPDYVLLVKKHDDFRWKMRLAKDVPDQAFEARFCHDLKPQFYQGMTLKWFAYQDNGLCWSVNRADLGWKFVRDEETGKPLLSPNCRNNADDSDVICEGEPQFPKEITNARSSRSPRISDYMLYAQR